MTRSSPPLTDEIEISLFRPGVGECVVLHLSAGNWMVVDSCCLSSGRPVALEYLESLGVDVATQVKSLVITHWHDDHIRGMADLLREAKSAKFACSSALQCKEFFTLVLAKKGIKLVEHSSGISEFSEILDVLQERAGGRFAVGPDTWVREGLRLYSQSTPYFAEVHGLSPSDQTITDAIGKFAKLMPVPRKSIRQFPNLGPNDTSVALLVRTLNFGILLGADLERGRSSRCGWQAVVTSQNRPQDRSSIFKVAHHGSSNGDLDDIWTNLLTKNPFVMVTPYSRSDLPSTSDVARLKRRANEIYCTAWPASFPSRRRGRAVEKTLKEGGVTLRSAGKSTGHIRIRLPITGQPDDARVELFDGAVRL